MTGPVIETPVPGLVVVRVPDVRESYAVIHAASGIPAVLDCAGPGSAIGAAVTIGDLLDWTTDAETIFRTLNADPSIVAGLERAAVKWGASTGAEASAA